MDKKWNFLMVLALLAILVGVSTRPVQAQTGILDVFPRDGTVGTELTLTGSDFGWKQGEVLIGAEKCKVLNWSDTEIRCEVFKPQPSDEYIITVLPQGDKKPAAPMTLSYFYMRRPHITPGVLVRDGDTATVVGKFFGYKKGEVHLAHRDGGIETESLKVLDWSMHSIRFELPGDLTGGFALVVRNEVGQGVALLDLQDGQGLLGDVPNAPGWGDEEAGANSSGVYYKGKFYTFSVEEEYLYQDDNWNIKVRTLDPAIGQFDDLNPQIPQGKTSGTPVPLVIEDDLWVFYVGVPGTREDSQYIYYQRFNYNTSTNTGTWVGSETHIPDYKTHEATEPGVVYDPVHKRIVVYREYYDMINWSYSDDFGKTWISRGGVNSAGGGYSNPNYGMGAIYFNDPTYGSTALLSFINSSGVGWVVQVSTVDGTQKKVILNNGYDWWGRPFLVDLSAGSGELNFAVIYMDHSEWVPYVFELHGIWQTAYQAVKLPVLDGGAYYHFQWPPNVAINYLPNSSGGTDRHLYLFYGCDFWASYGSWDYYHWELYDMGTPP